MTEIINKKETNDSTYTESSINDQDTLINDNKSLFEIPRYEKNLIKRRTSSIGSISNKMIKQLKKLNPSNYHNNITINDFSNELNTFDRYNKFYEEKSNKKYKTNKDLQSNYTTASMSSTQDNTVNNWTNTINDYWLKDTNIEDIEFDDSSDEEEEQK